MEIDLNTARSRYLPSYSRINLARLCNPVDFVYPVPQKARIDRPASEVYKPSCSSGRGKLIQYQPLDVVHTLDGTRMTRYSLLAFLSPVALFAGCATAQDSKDQLATETAELFGVKADQIAISNRRTSETTIYYTAKTSSVEYDCSTEITSVANLVMSMGVTHPPKCQKKAVPEKN